jgi:uncharacterized protein with gpF-like domain
MPVTIAGKRKKHRKDVVKGQAIRSPKAPEVEYRKALYSYNQFLKDQTKGLSAIISRGASASEIAGELRRRRDITARNYARASEEVARVWGSAVFKLNKEQYGRMVRRALGVDYASIVDSDFVREELDKALFVNTNLITTIPEQHFAKVAQAIEKNFRGEPFEEGSLTNRLRALGADSDERAAFIARDQTASFTSNLNRARQTDLGISEYIWRNQDDERVVGNPSGLFPEGSSKHRNHWEREGKTYRWDDPPADGNPGEPILCRCWAEPVIDLGALNVAQL